MKLLFGKSKKGKSGILIQATQNELIQQAKRDFYYWERRTPTTERYNVSLGKYIDEGYFIENLYKCGHPSCPHRFKTLVEANIDHIHYHLGA